MKHTLTTNLRDALFHHDRPGSIAHRLRARRWAVLLERFPDLPKLNVLDLGGTWESWAHAPVQPSSVLVVNLFDQAPGVDWIDHLVGDACRLTPDMLDRDFHLVYSNSVIEHVGGPYRRRQLAEVIRRSAPHHWVQTPARSFPIEPHWLFPGFHYLPVAMRARISRVWPFGHQDFRCEGTFDEAIEGVLEVDLLGAAEMRHLFPDSEMFRERVAGMTKSHVAIR